MVHQLGRNSGFRQRVLLQAPVYGAHSFDVLLPDGEQELDIVSFDHRPA
jgi:hypothetical protein